MSPIEPLSPTSMDLSPVSPTRARVLASIPNTPVIGPSLYLPRLVTSFQEANQSMNNSRRASLLFQLSTPSPLSLDKTPTTARLAQSPVQDNRRSIDTADEADTMQVSPTSAKTLTLEQPPIDEFNSSNGLISQRRMPSLLRQNANEGFERLQLCTFSSNTDDTTLLTPRPRSRSPITKHIRQRKANQRQRAAHSALRTTTPILIIGSPISPSTQAHRREIQARITHLSRPLVPLVSVTTGLPHPAFPTSLLQYQLLTHEQLDELVRWYHQTDDAGRERWMYPCPIGAGKVWTGMGEETNAVVDLQTKRRRWGRFIGLRGCESPVHVEGENVDDLEARMKGSGGKE